MGNNANSVTDLAMINTNRLMTSLKQLEYLAVYGRASMGS